MTVMSSRAPVLALDIGGTKLAAALVAPDGAIAFRQVRPAQAAHGGEAVMAGALALLAAVREEAGRAGFPSAVAVGVATAGDVDPTSGAIVYATDTLPGWQGMPVRGRIEAGLGLPAFVDNDGNAMALGETLYGAGRGRRHVLGLTVGTGIGGGLVLDGRIYRGAQGLAGRAGHLIVEAHEGRPCSCGASGCLEAYAAARALLAAFRQAAGGSELSRLGLNREDLGVQEIARLAATGHVAARAVLDDGAFYLGVGIASLLNLLNPEIVVVGGGVAAAGEPYLGRIRQVAAGRSQPSVRATPIVAAGLGQSAGLVGAAALAWQGLGRNEE